jgi:uncharacterized integral membrane protein
MSRSKTVFIVIIALLALIIILQNMQDTETRILFSKVMMPEAVLLLSMLVAGFFLGEATGRLLASGRKKGS